MDAKALLEEVRRFLETAPLTARTREQKAKYETYARVVDGWQYRMPTTAQREALLECTVELHQQVTGRTLSTGSFQLGAVLTPAPPAPPHEAAPPKPRPSSMSLRKIAP
jgi:hypothetical protein